MDENAVCFPPITVVNVNISKRAAAQGKSNVWDFAQVRRNLHADRLNASHLDGCDVVARANI